MDFPQSYPFYAPFEKNVNNFKQFGCMIIVLIPLGINFIEKSEFPMFNNKDTLTSSPFDGETTNVFAYFLPMKDIVKKVVHSPLLHGHEFV